MAHGPGPWLGEMLSARDDVWVQDAASVLAIRSIADLRPRVVADVCAGQGTKTRQLAATFPDAEIWASDPDPARSAVLAEFTLVTPPEFGGKKKKEDWDKWSKQMKDESVALAAEAAKGAGADKAKMKKMLVGLDRTCVACHDVFRDE